MEEGGQREMIRIVVGGDICPMGSVEKTFIDGNAREIFHDLLDDVNSADLFVANLECPLVSKETPIDKPGIVLSASTRSVQGFAAAKWDVVNLANNHSFDHGASGLRETIDAIKGAGLSVVGAGSNIDEARLPLVREINGKRIVIYAMAEREFSIADENAPGANSLDLINFVNAIREYKQEGIFIVLIHGGKEYYPYPTPEMTRRCRFMVDMGADAVICTHAHCPLPWEIYANRPIVYGLGNLIFEPIGKEPTTWHEGYLATLIIEENHVYLETTPYFQSVAGLGAHKMEDSARKRFYNEMEKKNVEVKDSAFLNDQWLKHCRQKKDAYLSGLFGYSKLMRKASRIFLKIMHSKDAILRALLLVQCESHCEVLNTIFRDERQNGR